MKEFYQDMIEMFNELTPIEQIIVQIMLILIIGSLAVWFIDSVIF